MSAIDSRSSVAMSKTLTPDGNFYGSIETPDQTPKEISPALLVGVQADLNSGWKKSIDDLLRIRTIGDDWDGEGAKAPLPELIDSTIKLISALKFQQKMPGPPARIAPINDGRVVLEWFFTGHYFSIRVDAPYAARWMLVKPDKSSNFGSIPW